MVTSLRVAEARYPAERAAAEHLLGTGEIGSAMQRSDVMRKRSSARSRLLARAVQVTPVTVPSLSASLTKLRQIVDADRKIDAFVFADGDINAFVSEAQDHLLVGFSSGAIERMTPAELEFVMGHELGHAALGHHGLDVEFLLDSEVARGDTARTLRGWQRAAEISADRAGLVAAESVDVGVSALFKTLSGLRETGPGLLPELLSQWDRFAESVLSHGAGDQWELSHPHPLLRIRALALYGHYGNMPTCNDEVARMLRFMDPTAESGAVRVPVAAGAAPTPTTAATASAAAASLDPYLTPFVFWGGVHVCGAALLHTEHVWYGLHAAQPPGVNATGELGNPAAAAQVALDRLKAAKAARSQKLSSGEISKLLGSILDLAQPGWEAVGMKARLVEVASVFGVGEQAVGILLSRRSL